MHETPTSTGSRRSDGEALAEALENDVRRLSEYRNWSGPVAPWQPQTWADMEERVRAAVAFICNTLEAVEPFASLPEGTRESYGTGTAISRDTAPFEDSERYHGCRFTYGDLRRLRTLTGASDER